MGFFDTLKKLDFQKIGKTIGKVAGQAGNIVSGYSNSQSDSTFGKIWSGIKNVDLGQVIQAGMDVAQQVSNVRNAAQQADVPQQALATYKNQQGFIQPINQKLTQQKTTQNAIKAVEQASDIIRQQAIESIQQIEKVQAQIAILQQKVQRYAEKQAIAGNGLLSQKSMALNNQLRVLNQDLLGITQNIINDSNTHEKAIHGIKNTISSLSNSPSLTGGSIIFQTDDDYMPRNQYSYRPYRSQFQRSQSQMYTKRPTYDIRPMRDYQEYESAIQNSKYFMRRPMSDYREYEQEMPNNNYIRKTKPIKKDRKKGYQSNSYIQSQPQRIVLSDPYTPQYQGITQEYDYGQYSLY